MNAQIDRLKNLKEINPNIRMDEIEFLENKKKELLSCLSTMELRLDSFRLAIPK
jgi:ATP-dependent helicase HepA